VGVTAAARVAFRRDQHMLAERREMMTTQRTSIRRRLAVRRAANRPPSRWRQVGHRSIVAPVAATLAASVALGLGVAVARVERDRRADARRRRRERRFGLHAQEPLGEGLRRIELAQLDIAIESIGATSAHSPEERVHEARKALKRVRALLRLLEDELGAHAYEDDSAVVREAGRRLAPARDAAVLRGTLDGLIERHPKRLGRRGGVRRLRAQLRREREGAAALALARAGRGGDALDDLLALRARIAARPPLRASSPAALEPALARVYGKGRKRMRQAARDGGRSNARRLHEWRKRVKDLRYVAEMLERAEPGKRARGGHKRSVRKRARTKTAFVRRVARSADDLGELLGEEHDLAVLAERIRSDARDQRAPSALGRGSRRALLAAIARRRRRLRKRALRDGARLYARRPKRFVRRVLAAVDVSRR
jgi:CHAD domain-containing protein